MTDSVLPLFPAFAPLSLDMQPEIESINSHFEPYSDFAFSNLWAWDLDGSTRVSTLNGNLIYRLTDYDKGIRFFTLIGKDKINETIHSLIKHAKQSGDETSLMFVPEVIAIGVSDPSLKVVEDRDNHDYILGVDELSELRSNDFRGKRNLLNRFHAAHNHEVHLDNQHLDPSCSSIVDFFPVWQKSRNKSDDETRDELEAITRTLNASDRMNLEVMLLFIGDKLAGYTTYEIVGETATIHFDKALVEYKGIYEFMKNQLALLLKHKSVKFINYEQDLGIEGLRKAKESYHPLKFLKKYTISLVD